LRQTVPPTEVSLRRAFESWLQKTILPRFGLSQEVAAATLTLEELENMLAESIDRWNREIREEGRQEGHREGHQEGRQEEGARMVLRLLRLKFGPLESEIENRVRSADADRLLEWGERVLAAESLQDIFKD
jgi:flagellar biosynthesis/type III secretory pathway protein FliH